MDPCIEHGEKCPYGGMPECGEMIAEITSAMRAADERFEKVGGSSRHFVRECLLPELQARGLKIVREDRR
jgi:hypothetical protein